MTDYSTLQLIKDSRGIAYLTLNRPEKRNALSAQMIAELTDFAHEERASVTTRAVVLTGAGPMFCAGGDLEWMHDQIKADRKTRMAEARKLAQMLHVLNTLPVPLIAGIHSGAFGGGVGLAAVCDVAIATDDTKFGLTETRLGLIPATIGPYVIARMGEGNARRVFMSSRRFGAAEAEKLGLIARSVPVNDLDAEIEAEIQPYLSVAPGAVAAAKRLARHLGPVINDAIIDHTVEQLADIWDGMEAAEGIAAFLEKRDPKWKL